MRKKHDSYLKDEQTRLRLEPGLGPSTDAGARRRLYHRGNDKGS